MRSLQTTFFKIPMMLGVIGLTSLNASWAMDSTLVSPDEVLSKVENAQALLETLPNSQRAHWTLWAAVSFSMPETSLMRLATDAKAAGIALVFRGVGTEPEDHQPTEKPQTQLQKFGQGFLARHLSDFKPLVKTGVAVKLDPKRFENAAVTDVPRLILTRESPGLSGARFDLTARGDVTLRFAIEALIDEIQNTSNSALDDSEREEALRTLQSALAQLGDRP